MEDSIPILDMELLAKLRELEAGDASGMLAKMIRNYLSSIPRQLEHMRELLARGDAKALAHEAHGLAGSSAIYGLPRLCQRSQALEACARRQGLEHAGELLAELERAFEEALPLLMAELSIRD